MLYQPELRNRELASIITYLRCLYPDLGQMVDMAEFDAYPEKYVQLIQNCTKSAIAIRLYLDRDIDLAMYSVVALGDLRMQLIGEHTTKSPQKARQEYYCTFVHALPYSENQAFVLAAITPLEINGFICQTDHYLAALNLNAILVARESVWNNYPLEKPKPGKFNIF